MTKLGKKYVASDETTSRLVRAATRYLRDHPTATHGELRQALRCTSGAIATVRRAALRRLGLDPDELLACGLPPAPPAPPKPRQPTKAEQARELHAQGVGPLSIAVRLGMSHRAVRAACDLPGLPETGGLDDAMWGV